MAHHSSQEAKRNVFHLTSSPPYQFRELGGALTVKLVQRKDRNLSLMLVNLDAILSGVVHIFSIDQPITEHIVTLILSYSTSNNKDLRPLSLESLKLSIFHPILGVIYPYGRLSGFPNRMWFETHFGHYIQQKESCETSKLGNIKINGPLSQAWSPPSTASEYKFITTLPAQ